MNELKEVLAYVSSPCDFCYIMPDDSMKFYRVFKGDLLCFRAADTVENGKIAAVRVNEEGIYIRKVVHLDSDVVLLTASGFAPAGVADGIYNADEVQIVGLLVESHHQFVPPVPN